MAPWPPGRATDLVTLLWEALAERLDLRLVDAASSGLVATVPRDAIRRGDLIVRNPDDSFGSFRLIARRGPQSRPSPPVM